MIGSGGAATSRHLLTCLSGKLTDAAPAAPQCPARLRGRRPLGSFSRAAEELGVTHGAVSRHVQTLEQFLGAALFRPQGRGRVPTERAAVYLAEVSAALDRLGSATERMREPATVRTVRVSIRSEEHTSELQSLMRISYAVFCL